MTKLEFIKTLNLPQDCISSLKKITILDEWIPLFDTNRELFFNTIELLGFETSFPIFLKLYIEIAYQKIQKLCESERTILIDGLQRLKEDTLICKHYWNIWGIMPHEWRFIDRLIDGKIKRLASLEFEEKSYPYPIKVPNLCIDANTTLLNIHVCSNADLTPEAVKKSFEAAKSYYPNHKIYHIESWLVSPRIEELCNTNDNLYQFQSLWTPYEIIDTNERMIERVFPENDDIEETYINFPEHTCLQRNAKKLLLSGKKLQHAKAIYVQK